jgi:GAF domain-containing protein
MLLPLIDNDVGLKLGLSTLQESSIFDRAGARPPVDFFAEASRLLSDSFLRATLATATGLALPLLGTWCMVDVIEGDSIRRLVVLHPDSATQRRARGFFDVHAPRNVDPIGAPRMIAASQSIVIATADVLNEIPEAETRDLLVTLGARSFLVVAMPTPRGIAGAITFGSIETRRYSVDDLIAARELARRCARHVECARSYGEGQMARIRAEHAYAMEDAARAEFALAQERGDQPFDSVHFDLE